MAIVLSALPAGIAAIVGLVLGVFWCENLLSGEMTQWALVVGPAVAFLFGAVVFAVCFRWFNRYGSRR